MRIRMQWWSMLLLLVMTVAPLSAQSPAMRARIDGMVSAFNGTPEEFEVHVQAAYTPELLNAGTTEKRSALLTRVRGDFGKLHATGVRRESTTRVVVSIEGATGTRGTMTLDHEASEPYKLTDLHFLLGDDEGSAPALPPVPINGGMNAAGLAPALDGYLSRLATEERFTGSVLLARDGKPMFERAYGMANRSDSVPNTNATRFNIGSINKHFTRAAIGQLIAAGKLATNDTIGKHMPDYPNAAAQKATVQQLIDMQGGISDFFGRDFDAAGKQRFRTNRDYYAWVAPKPLLFEPGTQKKYCNGCYIVLGELIERLSGMPYQRYVAENVFRRAGVQTARFLATDDIVPNMANGYTRMTGSLRNNVLTRGASGSGAGGAYATARDLLAFDEALRTGKLLDPDRTAWFFGAEKPFTGRVSIPSSYAGGAPGINAVVESGGSWTVIVLSNLDPPSAETVGSAIAAALRTK